MLITVKSKGWTYGGSCYYTAPVYLKIFRIIILKELLAMEAINLGNLKWKCSYSSPQIWVWITLRVVNLPGCYIIPEETREGTRLGVVELGAGPMLCLAPCSHGAGSESLGL